MNENRIKKDKIDPTWVQGKESSFLITHIEAKCFQVHHPFQRLDRD